MADNSSNNKRIAKNTIVLYIRMFFMMCISLFTSRVILQTLGVEDYGIYNVVGGVVAMFSIISNSLSSSISRFITYELGRKNYERLNTVFCTAVNVQILMAIIVLLIAEVVGVWFLNYKMNIPTCRLEAANWVLQCSLLTFCVNILSVPYNASIVAHEKMSAFAWISIAEAILKLTIVYLLWVSPFDKLIAYAILMLGVSIVIRLIYGVYCKRKFQECCYHLIIDKPLFKEMTNFAGWGFLGNIGWMLNTQGIDILLNLFFGVTLNAARGIAKQVESAVNLFVSNFMTAVNPQITKSYASGDLIYMHNLICWGAKFSFFLMLFFAIPICLEANTILNVWLVNVPEYAVDFVRLTFAGSLTTVLGNTMITACQATGKIKRFQIGISICNLLCFPLTWLAFKMGMSPISTYVIYFVVYFIMIFVRIYLVKDLILMKQSRYLVDVVLNVVLVTIVAIIIPLIIILSVDESFIRLLITCIVSPICTAISILIIGLKTNERNMLSKTIIKIIRK